MRFQDEFPQQVPLTEVEKFFKEYFLRHPERNLDLPHTVEYFSDVLKAASDRMDGSSTVVNLLLMNRLDEDLFFHTGFDVELYQHMRYLPAEWHSHAFFEIACVLEGSCVNTILDQELVMRKGDICIISPETRHAISVFSDDCILVNIILRISTFENAFFSVLSNDDVIAEFFRRALYGSKPRSYLLFPTGEDPEVGDLVLYAYREFLGSRQYRERLLNSIISAFFVILLRNHGADVVIPDSTAPEGDENVLYILKYLQENYCTLSLKELAGFFNYSERQIQRIIKQSTGLNFSDNVQKLKMHQAARLLKNPGMTVSSVAEELGYRDVGNFRHTFRKFYGMSPSEYRDRL